MFYKIEKKIYNNNKQINSLKGISSDKWIWKTIKSGTRARRDSIQKLLIKTYTVPFEKS